MGAPIYDEEDIDEKLYGDGPEKTEQPWLVEEDMGDPIYDESDDDEVLYGDDHEALAVRKNILTPKVKAMDACYELLEQPW